MAGVNINDCTTRQLIGLPGISRSLAESIIKLRDSQHGIQALDELLALPGMTRSKCRLLARRFSLSSRPLVLGVTNRKSYSKVTVAHTNFVCQGQSMAGKNPDLHIPPGSQAGLSSPTCVRKTASYQKRGTMKPQDTEYPYYKKQLSRVPTRNKRVNLYRSIKPYVLQAERANMNQREEHYKDRPHEHEWDGDKEYNLLQDEQMVDNAASPVDGTRQPSVTFKASASGNNINFCCTIDRRLLSNSAPAQTHQAQNWALIDHKGFVASKDTEKNHAKNEKRPPSEGIGTSKSSSEDDTVGDEPVVNVSDVRRYQHKTSPQAHGPPSTSTKSTHTNTTSSIPPGILCMMSVENLLLFDRQTRITVGEKRKNMERWVTTVNTAREDSLINQRKQEDRHRKKVHPYYTEMCGGITPSHSPLYKQRRGRYRMEDMGGLPLAFTSPENADQPRNRAINSRGPWTAPSPGKNRTESELAEEYVNQLRDEDVRSEKDYVHREMKVIIENKKILQKRAVKSGNLYDRTPAQLKAGMKEALQVKTPTKQLKHLINNYVLPRQRKK